MSSGKDPEPQQPDALQYLDALRRRGLDAVAHGKIDEALASFDEALVWAHRSGERTAIERAQCNRSGVLVSQGRGRELVADLRRILLSSPCSINRHLAAYNISRFHESQGDHTKSLFYARQAFSHAKAAEVNEFIARSHNQIANGLLLQSYFDEARDHYRQALALLPPQPSPEKAVILSNMGYCHLVVSEEKDGFTALFHSLRMIRRLRAGLWARMPMLGLSYGYLEIGRYDRARFYADLALELAEQAGDREHVRNSLYLLGEAEKLRGNSLDAFAYFARLQDEFYPDNSLVASFLMTTDVRKLINLMA